MTTVAERRQDRAAFLLAAYEAVDGSEFGRAKLDELAARLDMAARQAEDAFTWCKSHGFLGRATIGGGFGLSARGIDEAERLLDRGAQIPAALLVMTPGEIEAVERFLSELRRSGTLEQLRGEAGADAEAQAATIEAQVRSPRPRRRIVRVALRELYGLVHGAGGNALFELLRAAINALGG